MNSKRLLALLMSLLMLMSAFPISTFAETDEIVDFEVVNETETITDNRMPEISKADEADEIEEPLMQEEALPDEETPLEDWPEEPELPDNEWEEEFPLPETQEDSPADPDCQLPPEDDRIPLQRAIEDNGHAYVKTNGVTNAYSTADMAQDNHIFTITQADALMLATEYVLSEDKHSIKVCFITEANEVISAYIAATALAETILDDEAIAMTNTQRSVFVFFNGYELVAFVVQGEKVAAYNEAPMSDIEEPMPDTIVDTEDCTPEPQQPEMPEEPQDEVIEPNSDSGDFIEDEPMISDLPVAQIGDFISVTKQTRAFLQLDETATDTYAGNLSLGVFVKEANVQIEAIEQDGVGRIWYKVKYMFGDDFADGILKWTDYSSIYILADETSEADKPNFSVTDYAFSSVPIDLRRNARLATSAMDGFSLKSINAPIGSFTVGQGNLHGSSGKDSDYKQIASVTGHGTVYGTPHYLEGFTVYCLEHNLPGPGERISGGGSQPTGPYLIVDIDSYMNTPGNSNVIYNASTLHAIAWVLRHSYPFMVLDRNDSDNESWSRVAGQFAIREVIKQMEGAQYVRDYWNMSNFYVASGQAPAVYLTYARWLAANGIARGNITGDITISNKSVSSTNGIFTGTVTLATDADLMRISRATTSVTGHTAGADNDYYYLNSGDTISITSHTNGFSVAVESINSDAEEASFLVGVPSAGIQKVLIPQYGAPYELKSASIPFEEVILYGDLEITKRRDRGDQRVLANAVFQLYDVDGAKYGNPITTDSNGKAKWTRLRYGTYYVQEIAAATGYQVVVGQQRVEIKESVTALTITNTPIIGSIRFVKKASGKDIPLVGAKYELVTKAGNGYQRATSVVDGGQLPVLATDANGAATWTNLVEYGEYYVHEVEAPQGYLLDSRYHRVDMTKQATIEIANVTDDPITGQVRIVKKDQLTKEPLAGVVFTVTRLSAPVSHNGAGVGEVVATITTDANGVAATGWLEWGKYRVQETKVPAHYVDKQLSVDIEMVEHGKTYTIEVENEPTKGWIQIVKTDALDRTPIEGVQFDIYYNDEYGSGLATTMITNKDGVAISEPLRKGKYIVREHVNPTGYIGELVELGATVKSDETTHLSATNQPIQGKIRIIKKDKLTKEALAGAEFTITRISGLPSHKGSNDGEVVAVITTDADGIAVSPLLTWGTYRIHESKVPAHYVDNNFSAEIIIDEDNLKTYEIEVENEPTKGWIQLTKTDRQNGNPIEGVRFDIFYKDQYGEGFAASMVTDANGIAISEPLRKGIYIVREQGETTGYLFEEIALDATVKSDRTTELEATNRHVTVKLKLYKRDVDEYTGANPNAAANAKANSNIPKPTNISAPAVRGDGILTGAEFQVLAGEDIKDRQGNVVHPKGGIVVASLKTVGTDASIITDELWPGLYEITELTPPTGYKPSDKSVFVDARSAATQSTEAIVVYEGLKTNEIMYGVYGIVKFLGDNEIHDDAGIIETPEQGAEFQFYLKSAGSYENARKFERDYLTTNKHGYVMSKPLPYGLYVLKQVKGKEGYAIKSPVEIFIWGTEDPLNPPIMIINNEAIRYRIKFTKTDAETGNTILLANTAFKLKDSNGQYMTQIVHYPNTAMIDVFYTDATGEVTLSETVRRGMYFVEELVSPDGYLILTEDFGVFVGSDTMNEPGEAYLIEISIPNQPVMGNIVIEKKGLQLTGFETITDAYGNEYQQPIYAEQYLAGAVFEVRAAEDIVGKEGTVWYEKDDLVDTITTTNLGADTSKTLPLGKYYLTEIETPAGYAFEDIRYEANLVFADNKTAIVETKVAIGNEYIPAEISLMKEKEVTQIKQNNDGMVQQIIANVPGENAVFGLYNDTDIRFSGGTLLADSLIATGVTDTEGNLMFAGIYPHGDYYVKELAVPNGWKLNPEHFAIRLDPAKKADDATIIRVKLSEAILNELIYTPMTLTKTDITGQNTLPGALIEVRNSDDEVIYRAHTDENGYIPDIPVTPGTYTFREVLAPEGYALNEAIMRFTVDRDGTVTGDSTIRDDYTRVFLLKQDETSRPMAGVEFALLKADGTTLFTALSDANGRVVFEKIPYGSYSIVETKPLPGYLISDARIPIIVDGGFINSAEPIATIINRVRRVRLLKVDTAGAFLPDVEFSLINAATHQIVESVTSNEQGEFIFTKIDYGNWIVRETKVPDGFNQMPDYTFTVDESWKEPAPITFVNIPNYYAFVKTDNDGNPLAGVKFVLEDAAGSILRDLISGEDGIVHVMTLSPGIYTIRENETLEGYTLTEETIEVVIDEKYIIPTEMFKLINYPDIQTGVDFVITPVMMLGGLAVLAGTALLGSYSVKRKKKANRR